MTRSTRICWIQDVDGARRWKRRVLRGLRCRIRAYKPSTLNLEPSTLNPQTSKPQPSTLNSQPSTLNPQPLTLNQGRKKKGGRGGRGGVSGAVTIKTRRKKQGSRPSCMGRQEFGVLGPTMCVYYKAPKHQEDPRSPKSRHTPTPQVNSKPAERAEKPAEVLGPKSCVLVCR